jgi:hypothetical protein
MLVLTYSRRSQVGRYFYQIKPLPIHVRFQLRNVYEGCTVLFRECFGMVERSLSRLGNDDDCLAFVVVPDQINLATGPRDCVYGAPGLTMYEPGGTKGMPPALYGVGFPATP